MFRKIDTTANGKGGRYVESLFYAIRNPYTNEDVWPKKGTCWRHNKEEMQRLQDDNRLFWGVKGTAKTPMRKLFTMGRRAAQILLDRIAHPEVKYPPNVLMQPKLIVRESARKIRDGADIVMRSRILVVRRRVRL